LNPAIFLVPLAVFGVSCWLTGRVRTYALKRRILDVPNARSSHEVPTPRAGGLAIVLASVPAFVLLTLAGAIPARLGWGLVLGGSAVAAVGFVDDHREVPYGYRLVGHFLAAMAVVVAVGGLPELSIFGWVFDLRWVGAVIAVTYVVWMINLTNFMDGIDGIAAVQAGTTCLSAVGIHWLCGYGWQEGLLAPVVVAAAALGFLVWNWPPAKIFMGDVGSGFLGVVLGALALHAGSLEAPLLWSWLILQGAFMVDATMTLFRRVSRGERFHEAHRSHAYQRAARELGSHRAVTLGLGILNLLWLAPLALAVGLRMVDGVTALAVAYAPLIGLAWYFQAGRPAKPLPSGSAGRAGVESPNPEPRSSPPIRPTPGIEPEPELMIRRSAEGGG
jgi:Fuc2NAc and GlcNAc transferase